MFNKPCNEDQESIENVFQFIFSLPERKLGKFDVDFGEEEEEEVQGSSEEVQVRAREIIGTSLDT